MVANALLRIACYGLLSSSYKRLKRFCLHSAGFYLYIETVFSYMYVYACTHECLYVFTFLYTPICLIAPPEGAQICCALVGLCRRWLFLHAVHPNCFQAGGTGSCCFLLLLLRLRWNEDFRA